MGSGATLGVLASAPEGSTLVAGMLYVGSPALPVLRAAPCSETGEQACGALRLLASIFPALQLAAVALLTSLGAAPAAALASLLPAFTTLSPAAVTALYAACLGSLGAAAKKVLVGRLQPASGIKKYSAQNFGRMMAWVLEVAGNDLFGDAVRGSCWWNRILRARGVSVGQDVYIDALWAGDYELVSYGEGAVVDRGASVFAHLGMYKDGVLAMVQEAAAVGANSTIGHRAVILPGFNLPAGQRLPAGQLGMHMLRPR